MVTRTLAALLIGLMSYSSTARAQISLSPVALLNSTASTDSEDDTFPAVASDGAGSWVAVWDSFENLSGAGTDGDIFVSPFAIDVTPPVNNPTPMPAVGIVALALMGLAVVIAARVNTHRRF